MAPEATELDRFLRAALRKSPNRCPEARHLLAAPAHETLALSAHVAGCERCAAIVVATTAQDPEPHVQSRADALEHRARALFDDVRPGVLRMVVRAIGKTIEVLDLVGEVLEPVPVRSAAKEGLLVRHRFGDHDVTAHVSCTRPARFGILLDIWADPVPDTVRFSLFRGERELASEIPRKGRVLFPSVDPGFYRVVVSDHEGYVGELELTLQDAA